MCAIEDLHFFAYVFGDCPVSFDNVEKAYHLQANHACRALSKCMIRSGNCRDLQSPHLHVFQVPPEAHLLATMSQYKRLHFNFLVWCTQNHGDFCDVGNALCGNGGEITVWSNSGSDRRCIHNIAAVPSCGFADPAEVLASALVLDSCRTPQGSVRYDSRTWPSYFWFCYLVWTAIERNKSPIPIRTGPDFWRQLSDCIEVDIGELLVGLEAFSGAWALAKAWHNSLRSSISDIDAIAALSSLVSQFIESMQSATQIERDFTPWNNNLCDFIGRLGLVSMFAEDTKSLITQFNRRSRDLKLSKLAKTHRPRDLSMGSIFIDYHEDRIFHVLRKWSVPFVIWAVCSQPDMQRAIQNGNVQKKGMLRLLNKIAMMSKHKLTDIIKRREFDMICSKSEIVSTDGQQVLKSILPKVYRAFGFVNI